MEFPKSIDTSILNQNNSNFTKTFVFGDPLNTAIIDTLLLLLLVLLVLLVLLLLLLQQQQMLRLNFF